jgi:hypothetical protein
VVDSDIYLSRATSAFSREDFRSAHLFATVALESILKVLVEIASEPFSNSRFVEKLVASAAKLGMSSLSNEYLEITRLNKVDYSIVKEKMSLFKVIWDEIKVIVAHNLQALEFSHFRVKTELNYYLNPAFLQGMVMRTNSLIESGKVAEASRYLNIIFLDIVENYAWLKSSINDVKVDHTTLMQSLECLEEKNPKNYNHIIRFLDLNDATKVDASSTIEKVREKMLRVRSERKILIKNYL